MIEEKRLALSIVIPVYNESENLADLITSTSAAMQGFGDSYEILLVDDGSTDDSWAIMKSIARQDYARFCDTILPDARVRGPRH